MMMETPSHHTPINSNDRELDHEALSSLLMLAQANDSPDFNTTRDDDDLVRRF
jgi:hypothetical protein